MATVKFRKFGIVPVSLLFFFIAFSYFYSVHRIPKSFAVCMNNMQSYM